MGRDLEPMPLFPLNAVLLPYQMLPLHIFEERYRELVRDCLENDRPFGVVLLREGSEVGDPDVVPYMVGTTARIVQHEDLPDGRINLMAMGESRFRVRKLDNSKPYLVGWVEPIVELEWDESPNHSWLIGRAKNAFEGHLRSVFGGRDVNISVTFTDDPVALSFAIAGCVHLTVMEKQRLLEMTDTAERFRELIPILETQSVDLLDFEAPDPLEEYAEYLSSN
ncbi:MAG: Lon protease [Fimbriimonadales bacterium]|nr:MAG: peptidase S16 [Armatimonadota bacterium]MBV6503829.1 Lon protease [Fimbriimonadales bacterium]MCE7899631.1 peptidase S16 [Armatimonadetes bacterium ATM1]MDL1927716.1 peptidase S16 [Fimbriimonadia bacterium ATM]MBC6970686.1 peptidase S16 [Armatimonadota bacterium]